MAQSRPMTFLHTLRNTPWLAKLALLWFALTLGVAVASPMVNPQEELVICTSVGMVKVKLNADGSLSTEPSSEAQCPLCVVGSAAPSEAPRQPQQTCSSTAAHAARATAVARVRILGVCRACRCAGCGAACGRGRRGAADAAACAVA